MAVRTAAVEGVAIGPNGAFWRGRRVFLKWAEVELLGQRHGDRHENRSPRAKADSNVADIRPVASNDTTSEA